jgi:hypothetical protein
MQLNEVREGSMVLMLAGPFIGEFGRVAGWSGNNRVVRVLTGPMVESSQQDIFLFDLWNREVEVL